MARTGTNSHKKAAASVKGKKRVGVAPASKRTSPRIGKLLNHEKGEEKDDLVLPVVILPVDNPPVVLELSPEFENEAQHDLGAQVTPSTEENENGNVASDNESAPLMRTNETTDVLATTIDEVSQMLVDINGNAFSNESTTEEFEGVFPPSFEQAAQTMAGVPIETEMNYISNAAKLPARCLIDVGPVETGDVWEKQFKSQRHGMD
jgi:hypothetical protein